MNKKNKNSIFSLVVSILTLAAVTVGSTFAFFSTVIKPEKEIEVKSANFKLSASIKPLYNSMKIIPTEDDDIMKAFDNKCIDYKGWGACYAYTLTITSEGDAQDVYAKVKFDDEDLPNLKYLILDADNLDNDNNYSLYKGIDYTTNEFTQIGDKIHLDSGVSRNLILVVWLSNLNVPQEETGKSFTGYLTVDSTLGTKITGSITASVNNS